MLDILSYIVIKNDKRYIERFKQHPKIKDGHKRVLVEARDDQNYLESVNKALEAAEIFSNNIEVIGLYGENP